MNDYKNKYSIWLKALVMVVACLFLINSFVWAYDYGYNSNTLGVQSIFDRLPDEKLIKIALIRELKTDETLLCNAVSARETFLDKKPIILGFNKRVSHKKLGGYLIPCWVSGAKYIAYVDEGLNPTNGDCNFDVHVYTIREMKIYLKHQEKKDAFLSSLKTITDDSDASAKGRVVLSFFSEPIGNVLNFFKEIEETFEISPDASKSSMVADISDFANKRAIFKVVGYDHVPAEEIDHVSNRAIHVKARKKPIELELAIIHEILAKLGIPTSINDSKDVKDVICREYTYWKNKDEEFCPRKIIARLKIVSNWAIDLSECRFVDMDARRDRDYSFGDFSKEETRKKDKTNGVLSLSVLDSDLTGPVVSSMEMDSFTVTPKMSKVQWEKTGEVSFEEVKDVGRETYNAVWENVENAIWTECELKEKDRIQKVLKGHTDVVEHVNTHIDRDKNIVVTSGSHDKTIRLWRINKEGKALTMVLGGAKGHTGLVCRTYTHIDEAGNITITSGSHDNTVRLWKIDQAGKVRTVELKGHTGAVNHINTYIDEKGNIIVTSGSLDETVRLWRVDKEAGKVCTIVLKGHSIEARHINTQIDGEGNIIVTSSSFGKTVWLWRIDKNMWQSGKEVDVRKVVLNGHTDWVYHINTHMDGEGNLTVTSGSKDTTVRLWKIDREVWNKDQKGNVRVIILRGNIGLVSYTDTSINGEGNITVTSASRDNTVRLWRIDAIGNLREIVLKGHADWVNYVNTYMDGEGNLIVTSMSNDMTVRLWRMDKEVWKRKTRVRTIALKGDTGWVKRINTCIDVDENIMITTSANERMVQLWRIPKLDEAINLAIESKVKNVALVKKYTHLIRHLKRKARNPNYQMLGVYVLPYIIKSDPGAARGKLLLELFNRLMEKENITEFIFQPYLTQNLIAHNEDIQKRIYEYNRIRDDILFARKDINTTNEIEMLLAYAIVRGARISDKDTKSLDYDTFKNRLLLSEKLPAMPQNLSKVPPFSMREIMYTGAPINKGIIRHYHETLMVLLNSGRISCNEALTKLFEFCGYNAKNKSEKNQLKQETQNTESDRDNVFWKEALPKLIKASGLCVYNKSIINPLNGDFLKKYNLSSVEDIFKDDVLTLSYLKALTGRIAVYFHENKSEFRNNIRQMFGILVLAIIVKERIGGGEHKLINSYSDASSPKERYSMMELLNNIYTDRYLDVIKSAILDINPDADIISPKKWDIIKEFYRNNKAIADVDREMEKVKTETVREVYIRLVPAKQKIDLNYSSVVYDCIGKNEEAIYEKDFYLYRILIEGSKRIDGYIYVAERKLGEDLVWVLTGIQPVPGLNLDYDQFLKKVLDGFEGEVRKRGVSKILLSTDEQYWSNCEGMKRAIKRAGFSSITLDEEITFPRNGKDPSFTANEFLLVREIKEHKNEEEYLVCVPDESEIKEIAEKIIEMNENGPGIPDNNYFYMEFGVSREEFFINYCAGLAEKKLLIVAKDFKNKIVAFTTYWLLNSNEKERVKKGESLGYIPENVSEGEYAYIAEAYVDKIVNNGHNLLGRISDFFSKYHPDITAFCGHVAARGESWHEVKITKKNKRKRRDKIKQISEKIFMKDLEFNPMKNLELTSGIKKERVLCHIIADSIIPGELQKQMVQELEQETRKDKYKEKIVRLEGSNTVDFIEELTKEMKRLRKYYKEKGIEVDFDVAAPDTGVNKRIEKELGTKALAFRVDEKSFVQVEGIILALRALHSNNLERLYEVYKLITGKNLDPSEDIKTIQDFMREIVFVLPECRELDHDLLIELNRNIREMIKYA
ncbi:MAG: WD40 repeat domain-containing protein [Candidatus Omnitrophota bacterium]